MKTCNVCGVEKPRTEFHKHKRNRGGLAHRCKSCRKIESKRYKEENSDAIRERRKIAYQRDRENILRKRKEYVANNREAVKESQRRYREQNKEKLDLYHQRYRDENRDRMRARDRAYRALNPEKISERKKKYYQENRDKVLAARRKYYESNYDKVLEWVGNNRDKVNAAAQRRRARKAALPHEDINPWDVFDRDGWICQLCLEPIWFVVKGHHPMAPSLDHIVPISDPRPDNPGHVWSNVQLAHFGCNAAKGNRVDP